VSPFYHNLLPVNKKILEAIPGALGFLLGSDYSEHYTQIKLESRLPDVKIDKNR
jgi:hypothetical protein